MNKYKRLGVLTIEEVIPLIHKKEKDDNECRGLAFGYTFGITSLRLRTFARHYRQHGKIECVSCGQEASFFSLDNFHNTPDSKHPHINLFGVKENGTEVLFTHDHTLAQALGGENTLNNTSVMCSPCNNKKSKQEAILAKEYKKLKEHGKKVVDSPAKTV